MKPRILIQLDVDPHPSVFDGVVAVDAGVDHLFRHGGVTPEAVVGLVHGALFTRGPADLKQTAIFIGGTDIAAARRVFDAVIATFFGPFRTSILFDPNGCNTTAAAAVLAVRDGLMRVRGTVEGATVALAGGTGPVGTRIAQLLLELDGSIQVRLASRSRDRAAAACALVRREDGRSPEPYALEETDRFLRGADVAIGAGAAGVALLSENDWLAAGVPILIDLNAVPPPGIAGVEPGDKATERHGRLCWGALGIGGTKMKIHRRALESLFEANNRIIDAAECLAIGQAL
ncbi:MAG: MtdA bifunctional protein [Isosphaeraceae bacterium]|jgi:hypothetical protein|nr:MAG: MtdA bifunctional protein [Isosphaeraceae bacterium]